MLRRGRYSPCAVQEPNDPYKLLRLTLQKIAPLPEAELEYLRGRAEARTYSAGQALIDLGEAPTRCWFLASGFLRFFYITENGREYNKAFSRPGEIVMPLSAVLTGTPSTFVIAAVTEAHTLAFPTSLIPELYDRNPAWERIGRVLAEQMALRKEARERELLLDPPYIRFQRFADRYPELAEWIPQRQIASYIGVTEQALSRLLRAWRQKHLNRG
jgi:CRP-like cAMP-binding protein